MSRGAAQVPDQVELEPAAQLRGEVRPPGDKSVSHRALLLGALAEGTTTIRGLSDGDDVGRTARCVVQLGAGLDDDGDVVTVVGGRGRLRASSPVLDCGNSGTTMRLLCGLVATVPGTHRLDGDASLRRRPMDRVAVPLGRMGAAVRGAGPSCAAPLEVDGRKELRAIRYELPVASAQVKSAVLLAGLAADGPTTVVEPSPTRAHTEEMLARAQARVEVTQRPDGRHTTVWPSTLAPRRWDVPADPSQGAFYVVAGVLARRAELTVRDLELSEERTGFLGVLVRMGAVCAVHHQAHSTGDVVCASSDLSGTEASALELPSLDEVPVLAVAAAAARGRTRFTGVAELRVKESDRLAGVLALVHALGAGARAEGDDLVIEGLGSAQRFARFAFDAGGDHRMAMAAAVAATVGRGGLVRGFAGVATSDPGFLAALASLR